MGWVSSVSAFCCSGKGCVSYYQSYNLVPVWVGNANPLTSRRWVNSIRKRNSGSGPIATSKAPLLPQPLPFPYSTSTCRYNGKPTLKVKGLINNNKCNCNCNCKSNILIANCSPGTGTESTDTTDTTDTTYTELQDSSFDCVGTGQDVECVVSCSSDPEETTRVGGLNSELIQQVQEWAVLVSPFFFWGTSMVAMKGVLPRAGPFFVSAFRLIPAGLLLIAFAASRRRPFPSGLTAWLSIALFGLVDAACFQGFLAQGLQRTSAGLGSVIIDSQPLTVAVLAALFFGESIGLLGAAGLLLGVFGLLLLEAPSLAFDGSNFSLWQSGEWWMLLAAQSMAVGTVMVRWVSKYSDPVMATGWHMVIGGLPLVIISILNHENAVSGSLMKFTENDTLALLYTSIFGSAISYGVYFYSATKGSLTQLSSLTFLTPMFASIFGFLYLGETFSPLQLGGAIITIVAIYMVNYKT